MNHFAQWIVVWAQCSREQNQQLRILLSQSESVYARLFIGLVLIKEDKFILAQDYIHPLLIEMNQNEMIHYLWSCACENKTFDLEYILEKCLENVDTKTEEMYGQLPQSSLLIEELVNILSQFEKTPECIRHIQTLNECRLKLKPRHIELNCPNPSESAQSEFKVSHQENHKMANKNVSTLPFNFYGNILLNPPTLASVAMAPETWAELMMFHKHLASDNYVIYLDSYYRKCIELYGQHWKYLDITNVVYTASKLTQPKNYLEIGVRRGRTLCCAVEGCSTVNLFAFDMWMSNYAGMENPGPEFVKSEVKRHGHQGQLNFCDGNSQETIPQFFAQNPDLMFDMVTVDGDHSDEGARLDLRNVLPRIALGGILIFDDITHPKHLYLLQVWLEEVKSNLDFQTYEYTDSGYGVAFAIRIK
jgi:hypothetical protein